MADLISYAIDEIKSWDVDDPRSLVSEAASLLRHVLNSGGGYSSIPQWSQLLDSLEPASLADMADVDRYLQQWDSLSDQLVAPLRGDKVAKQKIGITVFITRAILFRFHPERSPDHGNRTFEEWKERLCYSLDKFVGFYRE